jgi:hypothetical protein
MPNHEQYTTAAENSGLRNIREHRYGGQTPLRRKEPDVFDNANADAFCITAGFVGVFSA